MKTYLHKLPKGFIITSDEEYFEKDIVLLPSKGWTQQVKVDHLVEKKHPNNEWIKVIAQQDSIDFSELSIDEQKMIGLIKNMKNIPSKAFSLKEAKQIWKAGKEYWKTSGKSKTFEETIEPLGEILSDKIFTKEDMEVAYKNGINYQTKPFPENKSFEEKFIQSISNPKSWEVEIEKEISNAVYHNGNMVFPSMESSAEYKPKFTNGKIKILRIL
jgi:hypothetical protein